MQTIQISLYYVIYTAATLYIFVVECGLFFLSPVFGVVSFTGPLWSWIPHTHKDNKNNFQTSSLPHPHLPPLCYTLTLHYITNQSSLQGGWGQWSTGWAALSHTHTKFSLKLESFTHDWTSDKNICQVFFFFLVSIKLDVAWLSAVFSTLLIYTDIYIYIINDCFFIHLTMKSILNYQRIFSVENIVAMLLQE